jgi:hypothetical protein
MIPAEWTVNQHAGRCYHVHGRIMGGKMIVPLAFVALVALLSVSISAADSTPAGRLAGVVTDSEGAAISNAVVVVHWDTHGADAVRGSVPGLTEDLRLTTDKAGGFSAELAPGFYDVAVFATAFSPQAFKLRLRTAKASLPKSNWWSTRWSARNSVKTWGLAPPLPTRMSQSKGKPDEAGLTSSSSLAPLALPLPFSPARSRPSKDRPQHGRG